MPVKFALVVIVVMTASSCSSDRPGPSTGNERDKGLVLSASVVTPADNLTMRYPRKHPSKLAIQGPAHTWFILHETGVNTSLMTDAEFRRSTSLTIQVATLTGVTWINGIQVWAKVFSKPGKYTIYMADNLETEPANTYFLMRTVIYKLSPE